MKVVLQSTKDWSKQEVNAELSTLPDMTYCLTFEDNQAVWITKRGGELLPVGRTIMVKLGRQTYYCSLIVPKAA